MMDSCIRMILDLRETDTPVTVKAKRGDTGRVLRIKLSDGSSNYPIEEDCYAVFTGKKPDDTVIYNQCSLEDGEIVYAFTEQTCTVAGQIPAEIRLYGSGGKLLTSASFILDVEDTVFGEDDVISQGEMNVLDALVTETKDLKQEIEEKLASGAFRGEPGPPGVDGTVAFDALTEEQKASLKGADGTVSFDELTEQQRLSLKGEPGDPGKAGDPGKSAYAYAVEGGFVGTEAEFAHKLAEEALLTAGGTMKGSVSMGGNALTGLPAPQAEDHAASKAYVDEVAASHTENAENPHGVTAQQVGARPDDWMPTAAQVGAATPEAVRKAAPRNLLDNSDFTNPVNQRGEGTVTEKNKYPVDRWMFSYDGDSDIGSCLYDATKKCIVLKNTNTTSGNNTMIFQKIPVSSVKAGTYTVAIHSKSTTQVSSLVFVDGAVLKSLGEIVPDTNGVVLYTFTLTAAPTSNITLYIYAGYNKTLLIDWVAMYPGVYTSDTLPEYCSKGYGAELIECMQHYCRNWDGNINASDAVIFASPYPKRSTAIVFPLPMRGIPTVSVYNPFTGSVGCVGDWVTDADVGVSPVYLSTHHFILGGDGIAKGETYSYVYEASVDIL